ncbi:MAG: IclR family transcriptional regulator [Novosphingobium sp.]|nr:IclR family transcriptional regulator [Novosphingobium sp.]
MAVLSALATWPEGATLNELSEYLELPRASLHRLLSMLQKAGYLINNAGTYVLGPETYRLARQVEHVGQSSALSRVAIPVINWLAEATGETVVLGVLSKDRAEIIYTNVLVADEPLRCEVPEGVRTPLYSSASGKAVLAFMPESEYDEYVRITKFRKFTEFTDTSEILKDKVPQIRSAGIVKDRGHLLGAWAIASPIFDSGGDAIGAIAVLGPEARIERVEKQICKSVLEAGRKISLLVGFSGAYPPDTSKLSAREFARITGQSE